MFYNLPEKTYIGLKMFNKGKPNVEYFQFFNRGEYNTGYENIKTGGRVIWETSTTLWGALKKVRKQLDKLQQD